LAGSAYRYAVESRDQAQPLLALERPQRELDLGAKGITAKAAGQLGVYGPGAV